MAGFGRPTTPSVAGRLILAAATVTSAVLGFLGDARWFAASGAFGLAWWGWDAVWGKVVGPLGGWFLGMLTGTSGVETPPEITADDTIRLLEDHLRSDAVPRHVQIQSALRLAEIYRTSKHDPQRAVEVLAQVRARWPDAPEWRRAGPPDPDAPRADAP